MNACYAINRKKEYVTIYNNQTRYPLQLWNELKTQHDTTHQNLANELLKLENQK